MTIVWLVTVKRFLREYHNHVSQNKTKTINWMVMPEGGIRFYIEQTNGSNCYCYVHPGNEDTLPLELKNLISIDGSILGVEGIDEDGDDELEQRLDDISNKIKFNMVSEK